MLKNNIVIIASTVLSLLASASAVSAQENHPNILFIFADDWGWGDLSCHGHPYVKTPNIDRLAKEGTDFHRFTVACGVCSPSRTAVMTGHFPARYNIDGHFAAVSSNQKRNMPDWLDPKAPYLARFLKQSGYATAHYGKWHPANDMIPDSPIPGIYGYDHYGAFNCSGEQMPWLEDAKTPSSLLRRASKTWMAHPPEYDRPLGAPKGPAVRNGYIYTREFAHASVRLDIEKQTGVIEAH